MAQTEAEKRAYQRGYNRAQRNASNRAWHALEIAKAYRDRLGEINHAPICRNCRRWTRGCQSCVWGICAADFERTAEPAMWAEALVAESHVDRKVITTEDFGCVNWLPRKSQPGTEPGTCAESTPSAEDR